MRVVKGGVIFRLENMTIAMIIDANWKRDVNMRSQESAIVRSILARVRVAQSASIVRGYFAIPMLAHGAAVKSKLSHAWKINVTTIGKRMLRCV